MRSKHQNASASSVNIRANGEQKSLMPENIRSHNPTNGLWEDIYTTSTPTFTNEDIRSACSTFAHIWLFSNYQIFAGCNQHAQGWLWGARINNSRFSFCKKGLTKCNTLMYNLTIFFCSRVLFVDYTRFMDVLMINRGSYCLFKWKPFEANILEDSSVHLGSNQCQDPTNNRQLEYPIALTYSAGSHRIAAFCLCALHPNLNTDIFKSEGVK